MTPPGALLLALLLTPCAAGCDEASEARAPEPEEPARALEAPSSAEEARDDSIEACVERLARETPRSVADTIEATGYDELFEDACAMRAAVEERGVALCAGIHARLVRRACEARVAIAARDPELCPSGSSGREPLCVALATRERALCRAAPLLEQEACATLLGEPSACDRSIAPELCEGIVRRHASLLEDAPEARPSAAPTALPTPELVLSFTRVQAGEPDVEVDRDLALTSLDRGARIAPEAGRPVLELADPIGLAALSNGGLPALALRVPLPDASEPTAPFNAPIAPLGASLEATHPTLGRLRATEGSVSITRLSLERGGVVEGTLRAVASSPSGRVRVTGRFRTFLRDVSLEPSAGIEGTE